MPVSSPKLCRVVLLSGPTAVGKSAAALELAENLGGEIVNGDSLQVYRYLDIGTAKPDIAERARVPHHLFDILEPDEPFNAPDFQVRADSVIAAVDSRGRFPLVVGGTGLYLKALLYGLCEMPEPDPEIRAELERRLAQEGSPALHLELAARDPEMAARLFPNDRTRVLRALETVLSTGRSLAWFQERHRFRAERYRFLHLWLDLERAELYRRIDLRVEKMLAAGLLDEVRGLLDRGFSPELKPLQSIGYRQAIAYLEGRLGYDEMVADIQQATRRYAKRQLTWLRHDPRALRIPAATAGQAELRQRVADFMTSPQP
jgi:tRNA dimethylallyltransferase